MDLTRLQPGDIINLGTEGTCVVWYVNASRAAVTSPSLRSLRIITDPMKGETVHCVNSQDSMNISPNSSCDILERHGLAGLIKSIKEKNGIETPPALPKKKILVPEWE